MLTETDLYLNKTGIKLRKDAINQLDKDYSKAVNSINSHTTEKLDKLYEQIEKVQSMRTAKNSDEVDKLLIELNNTRRSIVEDRNNALKDLRISQYGVKVSNKLDPTTNKLKITKFDYVPGNGHRGFAMIGSKSSKYLDRQIKAGKDIDKYLNKSVSNYINKQNKSYELFKSWGIDNPEN